MADQQELDTTVLATPPPSAPPPAPPGWTGAAMAVHAVRRMPTPMIVSLQPTGFDPMLIDMRGYVFQWSAPLTEFPDRPETVLIGTRAIRDAEPAFAGDDFVDHPPAFAGASWRGSARSMVVGRTGRLPDEAHRAGRAEWHADRGRVLPHLARPQDLSAVSARIVQARAGSRPPGSCPAPPPPDPGVGCPIQQPPP